ncbi:MAG: hypothetical protein O9249_00175, partial [Burkholderiaceae bacterium]|nr:hypothetical protein [Burkholderiaceae bacterium]
ARLRAASSGFLLFLSEEVGTSPIKPRIAFAMRPGASPLLGGSVVVVFFGTVLLLFSKPSNG